MADTGTTLSVFHFNTLYAGMDRHAMEKYCAHAIFPLLQCLRSNPWLRISVALSGYCLEVISNVFPQIIEVLRGLTDSGQVELICCMYSCALWPAYPKRDIEKSIEIAGKVLRKLHLRAADVFFAHEAFFGPGIEAVIEGKFSVAVCKDDYLNYFVKQNDMLPAYRIGKATVLVSANHLLNDLPNLGCLLSPKYADAARGRQVAPEAAPRVEQMGSVCWQWLHCGSGHHFSVPSSPYRTRDFNSDSEWTNIHLSRFRDAYRVGLKPGFVEEVARELTVERLSKFPDVLEGSWNSASSGGIQAWTGRHTNPWENSSQLLAAVWGARHQVRRCERIIKTRNICTAAELDALESLWKEQLIAEVSDWVGWTPSPAEVQNGFVQADRVHLKALQFIADRGGLEAGRAFRREKCLPSRGRVGRMKKAEPIIRIEILGGDSVMRCINLDHGLQRIDIAFNSSEECSGVRCYVEGDTVGYSPTGLDRECRRVKLAKDDSQRCLPLANGFLEIGHSTSIVRVNRTGFTAARINVSMRAVEFVVVGPSSPRRHYWSFLLVRGEAERAISLACSINDL